MTSKELLAEILQGLPENRLDEVADFARFLNWQEDREAWRDFGRTQLARAFCEDEPDYSLNDIKPEVDG